MSKPTRMNHHQMLNKSVDLSFNEGDYGSRMVKNIILRGGFIILV